MRVSIERGFSIPNVSLIEINAVPAKQLAVFLLKGASAMVLLLPLDILHHGIELTRTHGKGAPYPRCAILRDSCIRQVMCGIRTTYFTAGTRTSPLPFPKGEDEGEGLLFCRCSSANQIARNTLSSSWRT